MKVDSFGGGGHPEISYLKCRRYLVFSYQNNGLILRNPMEFVKLFLPIPAAIVSCRNRQAGTLNNGCQASCISGSIGNAKDSISVVIGDRRMMAIFAPHDG